MAEERSDELQRVQLEITESEEQLQRLRMSGLLHLSDVSVIDDFEEELREFERITEHGLTNRKLHSVHNRVHYLRSRIDEFSNGIKMF